MKRIGKKIESVIYNRRPGAYVIINPDEDHKIIWLFEYKDKLYHEYQRYILTNKEKI